MVQALPLSRQSGHNVLGVFSQYAIQVLGLTQESSVHASLSLQPLEAEQVMVLQSPPQQMPAG